MKPPLDPYIDPNNLPITLFDVKRLHKFLGHVIGIMEDRVMEKGELSPKEIETIKFFDPENFHPYFNILIVGEYRIIKQENPDVDEHFPIVTIAPTRDT